MLVNEYGELANETTLQALKTVTDNLYTAVTALNVILTSIDANVLKSDTDDVIISNFPASQVVTGPLTDSQLRAADVKVSLDGEQVSVSGPLTDSQLRAADVKVSLDGEQVAVSNFPATQVVTGPLTDSQLRAVAVPVSAASLPLPTGAALETTLSALKTVADGIDTVLDSINSKITACNTSNVSVSNFPATQAVSGPLTDTQLRAADVKVSLDGEQVAVSNFPASQVVTGPLTDSQLRAAAVPVSGPLTDTQLRAADVKVSLDGEQVAVSNFPASQAVTGPLTDSQLRAESIVVSSSSLETLSQEIIHMLRMIKTQIHDLPFYDRTTNRAKVSASIESGTVTTVTNVTTCGTVTNMTNVGSFPWDVMVRMQNRSAWANTCASRIS